jgi:hypothetical protein
MSPNREYILQLFRLLSSLKNSNFFEALAQTPRLQYPEIDEDRGV